MKFLNVKLFLIYSTGVVLEIFESWFVGIYVISCCYGNTMLLVFLVLCVKNLNVDLLDFTPLIVAVVS